MAENPTRIESGMNRIIHLLEEQRVELLTAGMYKEADEVLKRLESYRAMRNNAHAMAWLEEANG